MTDKRWNLPSFFGVEAEQGLFKRKLAPAFSAMVLIITALILYAPALGTTRFVFGTDTTSHDYIMHLYTWTKSIGLRGELPLWNPYIFSGLPMIGSAAICPFYPTQLLYAILPFNTAFTLQYALAVAVGGLGCAFWMRALGLRRAVALWAGLAYIASGHFLTLTHAGHLQKMIAIGWAPFAFAATAQLLQLGHYRFRDAKLQKAGVLMGVALGMQLLASHPQIFYATAGACVLHLVMVVLLALFVKPVAVTKSVTGTPPHPPTGFKSAAVAGLVFVIACATCVALSAVQLFPSLEMAGISNRAEGVSFEEATSTSYPPVEVVEYAVPRVFGDSVQGTIVPYKGAWGERIVSDYVGLPILFLALAGLIGSRRRYKWYLLVLLLVGLLIGFGRFTPLYWIFYKVIPGFASFRSPGTFMFIVNAALIALAALGLDRLLSLARLVSDRGWNSTFGHSEIVEPAPIPPVELAPPAEMAPPEPVAYSGTDTPPQNPSIQYDEEVASTYSNYPYTPESLYAPSSNIADVDTPWLARGPVLLTLTVLAILAFTGGVLALADNFGVRLNIATADERLHYHRMVGLASSAFALAAIFGGLVVLRWNRKIGAVVLAAAALAFPLHHNYYFLRFEPLAPYMAHLMDQPLLKSLAASAPQPIRLIDDNQLKTEPMLHGVASATGYHPLILRDYAELADPLGVGTDGFGNLFGINHARTQTPSPPEAGSWNAQQQFRRAGRQEYLWSRAVASPYVMELPELIGVESGDVTSATITHIKQLEAARIAGDVATSEPERFAFLPTSVIRRARLQEGRQLAEAIVQRWMPHQVRLNVRATSTDPRARVLLPLAEVYAPGWKGETSLGNHVPVLSVNGGQRALLLPQGEHDVRIRYQPASFRLGLFLSLLTGTVLLMGGAGTLTRRVAKGKKKVRKAIRQRTGQTGRFPSLPSPE